MLLETRLDSLVFRAGVGNSLAQARQMVNHGHFKVHARRVDVASYQVCEVDIVTLRDRERNRALPAAT